MVIAQKINGNVKEYGQEPIKGSKTLYNYLLKNKTVPKLSVIDYFAKDGSVSTTRFEVLITKDGDNAISPRIIASNYRGNILYSVEFLCSQACFSVLDVALLENRQGILSIRKAKNGSDLYTMQLETLLAILRSICKNLPR